MSLQNKKPLGQHWLKDRQILDEIADLAADGELFPAANSGSSVRTPETCLEIGPGLGTLTSSLLKRFPQIIAVEYDEKLAANLPKSFPGKDLKVCHEDILQFDLGKIPSPYIAVGNIPYYITSPIIEKLLTANNLPARIVLLVQKEVAERVSVGAGHQTILSLFAQNRAEVYLGPVVRRELFTPPPKVDSQVLILVPHPPEISDAVFALIKQGFSSPRKMLMKNLPYGRDSLASAFRQLGLPLSVRPADLSLDDWARLHELLKQRADGDLFGNHSADF